MSVAEASDHLRAMLEDMLHGRTVRTSADFNKDLAALFVACEVLSKLVENSRRALTKR